MEKVLAELKVLQKYREENVEKGKEKDTHILALGLSSRKNLCVNPKVAEEGSRESVDARCRNLTASWVREKAKEEGEQQETAKTVVENIKNRNSKLCEFYEDLEAIGEDAVVPTGVYTLQDLKELGRQKKWCPYFLARQSVTESKRGGV